MIKLFPTPIVFPSLVQPLAKFIKDRLCERRSADRDILANSRINCHSAHLDRYGTLTESRDTGISKGKFSLMQIAARLAVHAPAPAADQRRAKRIALAVPSDMLHSGYHGFDVVVRDISELGFRVDSGVKVKAKTVVRLRLPGLGMVLGRVVWCRKGQIGGEFINAIPPSRLRLLIGYRGLSLVQAARN
jgi:hypothetical protein